MHAHLYADNIVCTDDGDVVVSCRAFRQEQKQTQRNAELVDKNIIMSLLQMSMNRYDPSSIRVGASLMCRVSA